MGRTMYTDRDKQGMWIIGGVILLCFAVFGSLYFRKTNAPISDSVGCALMDKQTPRRVPVPQTMFLIDQSEYLTKTQQDYVKTFSLSILGEMATGEKVSLYTFSKGEDYAITPKLTLCKPDAEANGIYENERKKRRAWQDGFLRPLIAELDKNLTTEVGFESPIVESIRSVSRSKEIEPWNKRKQLIIVSDFLQHTVEFSQYRQPLSFDAWRSRYWDSLGTNLAGWDVQIIYLLRRKDARLQDNFHREFWQQYFYTAGATLKRLEAVE